MINDNKEYIICSAIWFKNGKRYPFQNIYGIDNGFVIGGFRHPMVIGVCPENPYFQCKLVDSGNEALNFDWNPEIAISTEEGFITSYGRFVDRKEAFKIAYSCGQITRDSILKTQGTDINEYKRPLSLYSEDIFPKQHFSKTINGEVIDETINLFDK